VKLSNTVDRSQGVESVLDDGGSIVVRVAYVGAGLEGKDLDESDIRRRHT
jgi:hypothetical protein